MKRGAYTVEAVPADVLAWLDRSLAEDKKAEGSKTRFGCTAFVLLFSGVGLFMAGQSYETLAYVGGGLGAIAVVFLVLAIRAETHDLDDTRIAACRGLVQVLRADLPPERKLRLTVDYRDYAGGAFRTSQQGSFGGQQTSTYRQRWLAVAGRLADGTRFRLHVVRRAERLDYWKQSRRKSKRRFKDKVRDRIRLELQTPGRKYESVRPGPAPLDLKSGGVTVKGDTVSAVVTTPRARRTTRVNLGPGDLASADRLLAALTWLHRGLRRQ